VSHRFGTANRNTPAAKARRAKYDSTAHRDARKHYRAEITAGRGYCWRCGTHIPAGTPTAYRGRPVWVVGHDDHNVNVIRGAECSRCNQQAATRKGARTANQGRADHPRRTARPFTRPDW
jgi:hypothetical protein